MAKYLDDNGVLYLWGKIKSAITAAAYSHPTHTAKAAGLYKVTVDALGHVSAATAVAKSDITKLGIPSENTTYTPASSSADGLMSKTDKAKLDGFGAASQYALKSDLSNLYKFKGSVTNASNLPTSGQSIGDVYNITNSSEYGGAGMNVVWTGADWDALGEVFTINSITNAEIDTICV